MTTPKDPFWSQVVDKGKCKLWTGPGFGPAGFGLYKTEGKTRLAHRVSWEQDQGAPPQGPLKQTCGNKRCVERSHLTPETPEPGRRSPQPGGRTA